MANKKKSILIILIAGIGDLILSSKSIRSIRNGFPDADIHLLTSTDAAPIAQHYEYIDNVWMFPIREFKKNKKHIFSIIKLILNLRKIEFDSTINLYGIGSWLGSVKMVMLFSMLKSTEKIGHDHKGFGLFIDKKSCKDTFNNKHFADAMMDIALLAGGKSDTKGIEIFWGEYVEKKWKFLFLKNGSELKRSIIGINPGGDRKNRRWDPDRFVFVANYLIENFNAKIILLGGPGEESIAYYIQSKIKNNLTNLAGKIMLSELAYIISQFDLLITNDSGPMHIAAAVKTPLVAIFGPENPVLMRPYTTSDLYRIVYKDVDCRPCQKKNCKHTVCLDLISPEEVIEKCYEMLELDIKG